MRREELPVYLCITALLYANLIDRQIVMGMREYLFASLSQLELLWHNDIYIVKMMEKLLEESFVEYHPFQR